MPWSYGNAVAALQLAAKQVFSLWRWLVRVLLRVSLSPCRWLVQVLSRRSLSLWRRLVQVSSRGSVSLWRWLVQTSSRASKWTQHAAKIVSSEWEACTDLFMLMVPKACKSQARSLGHWFVVRILRQIGKRVQLAANVLVWVVFAVAYSSLLVLPELIGMEFDALAFISHKLIYGLIYIAFSLHRLSMHLANAARGARNIRTMDGYFEY